MSRKPPDINKLCSTQATSTSKMVIGETGIIPANWIQRSDLFSDIFKRFKEYYLHLEYRFAKFYESKTLKKKREEKRKDVDFKT